MGIRIYQYLLIGVKLDFKNYHKKFEENDEALTDYISQISDGYNGDYIFLGHVIEKVNDYDDLSDNLEGFNTLMTKYETHFEKVREAIKPFLNEGDNPKVDMFNFKHYT